MKSKLKRLGAIGLLCIMLVGMSITAGAVTHECAYSYMGTNVYRIEEGPDHPYTTYENGKMVTKYCHITYIFYKDVYKCACGSIEHRNTRHEARHSKACGQ